jgi:GntR family transcriptional regulator
MRKAGLEPSSQVIEFKTTSVPEQIAKVLEVEPDSTVVRLDRLRLGDGQPIAFDITWMPLFYGQLIEDCKLEDKTIYDILEQKYDIPVEKGYFRIEAENAGEYISKHLDVDPHEALLLMDRLSLTVGDKPIYYQKRYYRPDQVVYELMVERDSDSEGDSDMPLRELIPRFTNGK